MRRLLCVQGRRGDLSESDARNSPSGVPASKNVSWTKLRGGAGGLVGDGVGQEVVVGVREGPARALALFGRGVESRAGVQVQPAAWLRYQREVLARVVPQGPSHRSVFRPRLRAPVLGTPNKHVAPLTGRGGCTHRQADRESSSCNTLR